MRKPSIVIVEDERNIAKAQELILSSDYEVHLAYDGEEGLAKIKSVKPDVAILDWMLPKMSGIDLCKKVKADKALGKTKVVMVTAKSGQEDEDLGIDSGADDYIMKPFEPVELMHVIGQVLKQP